MGETRYNLSGEKCLKSEITVENLIDGDVFMSKSGVTECPRQGNILHNSRTMSKYFDTHHQKVKRKGIVFICVMAIVIIAIVILVKIIWRR